MRQAIVMVIVAAGLSGCGGSAPEGTNAADSATEIAASASAAASSAASSASAAPDAISAEERAGVLMAANLTADATGMVENECGEKVMPQLLPVALGSAGPAVLLVMTGGPNSATCYGDGPGLTLVKRDGAAWRQTYSSRGGMLVVMKDTKNGAPTIVHGGPGFSHPAFEWNGTEYVSANREVADEKLGGSTFLP